MSISNLVQADPLSIARAAGVLRSGGIVAFPTETVYGLGADALNPDAVARIFAAKGRPSNNPLIVHIHSIDQLSEVAEGALPAVAALAEAFWPGPLTLVLPKGRAVPDNVTAGGDTVGVRIPDHPVALALIRAAGTPIAAPSANRSEEVSPTTARHVLASLGSGVDLILDGGACAVGVESTVLSLSADPPVILRPGAVSAAQIGAVMGAAPAVSAGEGQAGAPLASPGQMRRHYSPRTPLRVAADAAAETAQVLAGFVAVLTRDPCIPLPSNSLVYRMPAEATDYARALYATLRDADDSGAAMIVVETLPCGDEWMAVRDRLRRASSSSGDAVASA